MSYRDDCPHERRYGPPPPPTAAQEAAARKRMDELLGKGETQQKWFEQFPEAKQLHENFLELKKFRETLVKLMEEISIALKSAKKVGIQIPLGATPGVSGLLVSVNSALEVAGKKISWYYHNIPEEERVNYLKFCHGATTSENTTTGFRPAFTNKRTRDVRQTINGPAEYIVEMPFDPKSLDNPYGIYVD